MLAAARSTLIAIALLGVAACAPSTPTADDTTADEAAIRAADLAHANAYYAGQVDTILLYYANDAVVMPPDAPAITGHEAIRKFRVESMATAKPGELNSLGNYTVAVSGNVGWSAGTFKVTGPGGSTVETGKFISTWRKTDGKWLQIRETWNDDAPAAPPK